MNLENIKPIYEEQTPIANVVEVFDQELKDLVGLLLKFVNVWNQPKLAGLAANQLSLNGERINKKICIILKKVLDNEDEVVQNNDWIIAINPTIKESSVNTIINQEGCLTWPEKTIRAERHISVTVEYQDLEGNIHTRDVNDFESMIWQHEINHLNGVQEVVLNPKTGKIYGPSTEQGKVLNKPDKVGRNDLCPCGSEKKYKKCCSR